MAKKSSTRGRPSTFDPKYVDMLLEYFDIEPYREVMKKIVTKQGDVIEIPQEVANDTPNLSGFARQIRVNRDTMLEWCKKYPDFNEAYKLAKEMQADFLIVNVNKGLLNPAGGIFTMKNVMGWRDRLPGEEDKVVVTNNVQVEKVDIEERIKQLKGEK